MQKFALAGAAIACLATQGFSQSLNELYVSMTGTDDQEFVEIKGTGGASLDGMMLLVIEGESTSAFGTLDRAIDLTGNTIPLDGYFVVGNTAVTNLDLDAGASNVFENGTETFYLISTTDVAAVTALLGTNVDADLDLVTDIANMSTVTILDLVAMTEGGTDVTYDGAQTVGPDGTFLPAGIFRGEDAPNGWCLDTFLDFNLGADRTPGAMNISCPSTGTDPGTIFCDGSGGNCPCGVAGLVDQGCPNTNPNGNGAKLVGTGVASFGGDTLGFTITDGAFSKAGIIIQGGGALNYPNGNPSVPNASGIFCVNPTLRSGVFLTDGSGNATVTNFQGSPFGLTAQGVGSTTYYQYWYRDPANACQNPPASSAAFNFSNGYEVDWTL